MRNWARKDNDNKITTVESYSHDLDVKDAIEITDKEYKDFIDTLPEPVIEKPRDLLAEIDLLKARLATLETSKVM